MLTVSAGPGSAKVPSTAGLTAAEAEEELEEAGFDGEAGNGELREASRKGW